MTADNLARGAVIAIALGVRDDSAHVADVAGAHADVVGNPGVHPRGGEAVHHVDIFGVAHHAAGVYALARHGAHGDLVAVVDLGLVQVVAVGIARIHVDVRVLGAGLVIPDGGQHAAVFNFGILRRTNEGSQIQALATQAGNTHHRVIHRTAALHGAVVHMRAAAQLARDNAAHDAGVRNQRHRIVGRRNRDSAVFHTHRFDARVPRLAHQHTAAEIGTDVAIAEVDVVNVGAFGKGEEARVRLGFPEIAMVVQADDVVALSVEAALERMVLVAEGERAVLLHDFFELAAVLVELAKIDIGRQLDVARIGCLARLTDLVQQLIGISGLAVKLVDKGKNGNVAHDADLEQLDGLGLHALGAVDHHNRGVRGHQGAVGVL